MCSFSVYMDPCMKSSLEEADSYEDTVSLSPGRRDVGLAGTLAPRLLIAPLPPGDPNSRDARGTLARPPCSLFQLEWSC